MLIFPDWFQDTQLLCERLCRPTQRPSLPPQCTRPSAPCGSGVASPCQDHIGLGSDRDLLRGHSACAERISQGFLMQNWMRIEEIMEKPLCLISPFPLFGEEFSICDHPCFASLLPSCRAHHTSQVKWDSRALQEGQPAFLIQS